MTDKFYNLNTKIVSDFKDNHQDCAEHVPCPEFQFSASYLSYFKDWNVERFSYLTLFMCTKTRISLSKYLWWIFFVSQIFPLTIYNVNLLNFYLYLKKFQLKLNSDQALKLVGTHDIQVSQTIENYLFGREIWTSQLQVSACLSISPLREWYHVGTLLTRKA